MEIQNPESHTKQKSIGIPHTTNEPSSKPVMPPAPKLAWKDDRVGMIFPQHGVTACWLMVPSDTIWIGLGTEGMVTEVQWQDDSSFSADAFTLLRDKESFRSFGVVCRSGEEIWVRSNDAVLVGIAYIGIETEGGVIRKVNYHDILYIRVSI